MGHGSEMEDTAEWLYLKVRLALVQGRIGDAERDLQKLKQHNNDDPSVLRLATAIAERRKDLVRHTVPCFERPREIRRF